MFTINCEPSKPPVAVNANQPPTLIQPVKYESTALHLFGLTTATQCN